MHSTNMLNKAETAVLLTTELFQLTLVRAAAHSKVCTEKSSVQKAPNWKLNKGVRDVMIL